MIRKFTPLDEHFRRAASDYEERPSSTTWDKISRRLPLPAGPRRTPGSWFLLIAALVAGVLFRLPLMETPLRPFHGSTRLTGVPVFSISNPDLPGHHAALLTRRKQGSMIVSAGRVKSIRNPGFLLSMQPVLTAHITNFQYPKISPFLDHRSSLDKTLIFPAARESGSTGKTLPITESPTAFEPVWTLTPSFEYRAAHYRLDNDQPSQDYKTIIAHRESHEPSFSFALRANWQYATHWNLGFGVEYQQYAIGIGSQTLYAKDGSSSTAGYKYITSSGYSYLKPDFTVNAPGDSIQAGAAQHQLCFLTLPVELGYQRTVGRWKVLASIGAGVNYLLRARVETELAGNNNRESVAVRRLQGMNSFFVSAQTALSMGYVLNRKWSLLARASFSYALTPINRSNVVKTFPYSLGTGAAAVYSF